MSATLAQVKIKLASKRCAFSVCDIHFLKESDDNSKVHLLPTEGAASAPQTHTFAWKRSPRSSTLVITRIAAEE